MKKVRKAIIPAAGLGTRFLPATKAMPKEMLPIIDTPTIQYIVEEAVQAGIEDIIIITGKAKRAIEDHFDTTPQLELALEKNGKFELLKRVQYSSNLANIHYIRQKEPLGLGHAVWCARRFIGDEPFAVLLGDDIVRSNTPCIKQLIDKAEEYNSSVIGVQEVPMEETHRYGIIDPLSSNGRLYEVRDFVEKPTQGTAPSNLAIIGRYVLTPEIFDFLGLQEKGKGGEIQLTDAIQKLNEVKEVYAYAFEGDRYDIGEKMGYLTTTIQFALQQEDIKEEMVVYLKELVKSL